MNKIVTMIISTEVRGKQEINIYRPTEFSIFMLKRKGNIKRGELLCHMNSTLYIYHICISLSHIYICASPLLNRTVILLQKYKPTFRPFLLIIQQCYNQMPCWY